MKIDDFLLILAFAALVVAAFLSSKRAQTETQPQKSNFIWIAIFVIAFLLQLLFIWSQNWP